VLLSLAASIVVFFDLYDVCITGRHLPDVDAGVL
jgi:hypothetical protein